MGPKDVVQMYSIGGLKPEGTGSGLEKKREGNSTVRRKLANEHQTWPVASDFTC